MAAERGMKPVYTAGDLAGFEPGRDLGDPGSPPFTRGVQPRMYLERLWTMRQYAGFSSASETNRRFRYLLEAGQTGLSTAFDLPTQLGLDADDPLSAGEVGKVGVSISSLEDMDELFEELPLDRVSTSMTINSTAAVLLAMYVAVARRRNISEEKLSGTVQNDILKEYVARGTHVFPIAPSMRLVTDVLGHCAARMPKFNPISISGYHIREAGSTAAQELAFTFGDGLAYVAAAREAGIDLARLLPRLSFFFNVHNNFLEEIAKFRAARRLWSRLVAERFGVEEAACRKVRFHAQTAGCTLTAREPGNNVTRVALQALAAVLGGCQSLHTNSRDEALGLPTEESARIALRTQQIVGHESGVTSTVDPFAGSYCIESLTNGLEREATTLLAEVDRLGGMKAAIESGWVQRQIQESAWRQQQDFESGRAVVVGVNRFVSSEESTIPVLRIDPEVERRQHARLAALRRERDGAATARALAAVEREAAGTGNLVGPILEAVERRATLGEVIGALKRVYGQHVELRDF